MRAVSILLLGICVAAVVGLPLERIMAPLAFASAVFAAFALILGLRELASNLAGAAMVLAGGVFVFPMFRASVQNAVADMTHPAIGPVVIAIVVLVAAVFMIVLAGRILPLLPRQKQDTPKLRTRAREIDPQPLPPPIKPRTRGNDDDLGLFGGDEP